ncbi:MAG: hypothetical protein V4443_04135 [Pseudomonadota bacterium]
MSGIALSGDVFAARISDVKNTLHNFSVNAPARNTVRAVPEVQTKQNQICVFCHTPHNATPGVQPIWNKKLSTAVYTTYTSNSLDALDINGEGVTSSQLGQPAGSSKLCLSCHDGTLAVGDVNVMWGLGNGVGRWSQQMLGTDEYDAQFFEGKIPFGGNAVSGVIAQSGASAAMSGYTRRLGTNLTNTHPISVTFSETLANRDGEMRHLDSSQRSLAVAGTPSYTLGEIVGVRGTGGPGYRPKVYLEPTGPAGVSGQPLGQVQCASCHDPHFRDTDPTIGNIKFLRLNRLQTAAPSGQYNDRTDVVCLACHTRGGASWAYSAHANAQITDPSVSTAVLYTTPEAEQRQFPTVVDDGAATNLPVWKAACLNCHDVHTVTGSRRLLREGTDSTENPKVGGNPAIEETCYMCHSPSVGNAHLAANPNIAIQRTTTTTLPDIESDFNMARHMPIKGVDQAHNVSNPNGNSIKEVHDIGGNFNDQTLFSDLTAPYNGVDCTGPNNHCGTDFVESRELMGRSTASTTSENLINRHVECTDCHNPHRMVKFQVAFKDAAALAGTPDLEPTHPHVNTNTLIHNNIASGVLRGTYGVQPIYGASASFYNMPTGFDVKRGDPGADTLGVATCSDANQAACDAKPYVTREYQICLKCHSNYGFSDNNLHGTPAGPETGNRPLLGSFNGGTPTGTNGLRMYTNIAREIYAPDTHKGELSTTDSGAFTGFQTNNHRSWHPVMDSTGRTPAIRSLTATQAWVLPWSNAVGTQTMYCTDCHGSATTVAATVIPTGTSATATAASPPGTGGAPWGPHGSDNNFILKGVWDKFTGTNGGSGSPRSNQQNTDLCFKCHNYNNYADPNGSTGSSGFSGDSCGCMSDSNNLHVGHADRIGHMRCSWCHVAVVHGWKNKSFLVNLNDVGQEAGFAGGGHEISDGNDSVGYVAGPYYNNAVLKILNFARSGNWSQNDCGSRSSGDSGRSWMTSNDGCAGMP